jgi:hypothetical protein
VRDVLDKWLPDLVLLPWQELNDPQVATLSDELLILILHQRGYDGLVTVNYKMLVDPAVLAMIQQTRFTVVACQGTTRHGVGDDYLASTGLLLMNLPNISEAFVKNRPQAWLLRATVSPLAAFKKYVKDVETKFGFQVKQFHVSAAQLAAPVLGEQDQVRLFD